MKKRKIVISTKRCGGFYVDHFAGETLIAEKRIKDHHMRKLQRMILNSTTLRKSVKESARKMMAANYEYVVLFTNNPGLLKTLKRMKAKGLNENWIGISCPLWMATEMS